jgi:hypothetical protein
MFEKLVAPSTLSSILAHNPKLSGKIFLRPAFAGKRAMWGLWLILRTEAVPKFSGLFCLRAGNYLYLATPEQASSSHLPKF